MNDPKHMSDEAFLAAFADGRLPRAGFDHYGHVRAAWLLLQRYPVDDAVERTCSGIARIAARLGAPEKYHRTLTEALVRLIAHRCATSPASSWEGFLADNGELMSDARAMIAQYYSERLLASPEARAQFVAPDRRLLPT